ncbi:sulfotransferase [Rhodococcus jostii]|uniref:sulfotransferase n=1 Tax=Rhodococcus jostii TaxID=132919 RepID=UPI0036363E12
MSDFPTTDFRRAFVAHTDSRRSAEAAEVVALLLAGFLNGADVAEWLGFDLGELESLLIELGLSGAAMTPVAIDDELNTYYFDLGRSAFAAPRFDDVVDFHRPSGAPTAAVARFRLPMSSVLGATAAAPLPCPAALVFHVGRCGSTLLCNLLASVDGWVTLKEPEFVNGALLRLAAEADPIRRERLGTLVALLLRSLAHGVRIRADGRERACIVKFTSWNVLLADEFIRRLDPIPLVVLTRDPWATVASLLHEPPHWYGPPPKPAATRSSARADHLEAARFFAAAWTCMADRALRLPAARTLFVSYPELVRDPMAALGRVCRHLGHGRPGPNIETVGEVARRYSKSASGEQFEPLGKHHRDELDAEARDLVATITAGKWSELANRTQSG